MFYRPNTKTSLLQVDDFFATLKKVHDDGMVEFVFHYSISQKEVIKNDAYYVNVTIHKEKVNSSASSARFPNNKIDPSTLVDNLLTGITNAKSLATKNFDSEVFSIKSDITALIDNQLVSAIKKAITTGDDSELPVKRTLKVVPAKKMKQANTNQNIFDKLNDNLTSLEKSEKSSIALKEDTQTLSHDLILKKGIDPATVIPNTKFKNAFQTLQSISLASKKIETASELGRLDNHVFHKLNQISTPNKVFESQDDDVVTVISNEKVDIIKVPVDVKFKNSGESYVVTFDLMNVKTGEKIDSVTKSLDVYQYTQNFSIPTVAPKTTISKPSTGNYAILEVKQLDPNANNVLIYKKNINSLSTGYNSYVLVDKINLLPGQSKKINITSLTNCDNQIYRAVPATNNFASTAFSGAVIKSNIPKNINSVVITSKNTTTGIEVIATNIPNNAVSVRFLRKNLSLYETKYTPVGKFKIKEPNSTLNSYQTIDNFVHETHVYEYVLSVGLLGGSKILCGNEMVEFVKESPGKVKINVSEAQLDQQKRNVTFTVNMSTIDKETNQIKKILQQQEFDSYYESEISDQKEKIKDLMAYSVERINLSTGERENLGVQSEFEFDSSVAEKKSNVKPMEPGKDYRYVIKALVRSPETVLENYKKIIVDPISKKKYVSSPYTSKHPIALKKGTIVTKESVKTHYSKGVFEYGEVGCTTTFDVSMSNYKAFVRSVTATKISEKEIMIFWEIFGNYNQIDHFILSKKNGSTSIIIDTFHPTQDNNICKYKHNLGEEIGNITYSIIPVYNNYVHGNPVESNSILVES